MIRFSEEYLRDRIYACWIGKNIGGTLGAPYEGRREIFDIDGFSSKPGKPLPNDDLDLQLVWLRAVNDYGPEAITSKLLGEYWISYITPNWNEYGVGKGNMRDGIIPPMSGEYNNDEWKNSNGAWIRTEIWASLYPGNPERAIRYAYEDASVDHGLNEGTYAAIFVAALESSAYVFKDRDVLLDIALSKIPEDCRVARSVKLVRKAYADGVSWKECREMVVKDSADLGWFQAPGNVAFTMIGFLYGELDFKKSLIIAIDCGDDTDCTGATLGALLGIMGGMEAIPEDWRSYIGDEIVSACLSFGSCFFPSSCTQLTDCVMDLLPVTLRTDHDDIFWEIKNFKIDENGDNSAVKPEDLDKHIFAHSKKYEIGGENDFSTVKPEDFYGRDFVREIEKRKKFSYVIEGIYADVLVEFDSKPVVGPNGTVTGELTIKRHTMPEQKHYRLRFLAPDGWKVDSAKNLYTPAWNPQFFDEATTPFTITAGENVDAINRIILEVTCAGRPMPILVPIQIMG